MAEYDNTNSGAIFRNEDKQDEKHADYNGSLNVEGVEYWVNGWIKTSKAGKKFMSLSVKPKVAKAEKKGMEAIQGMDSDLPF
jgi:uncharacterized protein (DUF736 family)